MDEFERFLLERKPPPGAGDIEVFARQLAGDDKEKQAALLEIAKRSEIPGAAEAVERAFKPPKRGRGGKRRGAGRPRLGTDFLDPLDFVHVLAPNQYIYRTTRELCSGASVNRRVLPVEIGVDKDGEPIYQAAAEWVAAHQAVEQMTWAPGEPEFIKDKHIAKGGWFSHEGAAVYNVYSGPVRTPQEGPVAPYLNHLNLIYPREADEILDWIAFKVQHPGVKINHALLWIGNQGIGKDTLLEPLREAVGPQNFTEVAPKALLRPFNEYEQAVFTRISEAKDLGEIDRYAFYERTKTLIAAPPMAAVINPKYEKPYYIPNVTGVIITSNHETHGIYLPADDRRHLVCLTRAKTEDFDDAYWNKIWNWYDAGGYEAMMYFFLHRHLSKFNPKAPPRKTDAFYTIVENALSAESAAVADAIDGLGRPPVLMWSDIKYTSGFDFGSQAKFVPGWLHDAGYLKAVNPNKKRGKWTVNKMDVTLYGDNQLNGEDTQAACKAYKAAADTSKPIPGSKADKAAKSNVVDLPKIQK